MTNKIMDKLKRWGWLIVLAVLAAGRLLMGKNPSWVKDVERSIRQREKEIGKLQEEGRSAKDEADKIKEGLTPFDEVVKEQDEKIAQAGKVEEVDTTIKPITNPSDIADFIKERAGKSK